MRGNPSFIICEMVGCAHPQYKKFLCEKHHKELAEMFLKCRQQTDAALEKAYPPTVH